MKHPLIAFFTYLALLVSCGPSAEEKAAMERCRQEEINIETLIRAGLKSTFDAPFPKQNRNLVGILGDTIQITGRCSPLTFRILSTRKSNLIIDVNTGDTLFKGTVCKYRDLYYFSEQVNDTSFRIFALNITDSLIYGLQHYFQYARVDSAITNGKHPKLVKFISNNQNTIRLHPDKKELRKLFTSILAGTEPFEIIKASSSSVVNHSEQIPAFIEPDDLELLSKVYPNPAADILNVELYQKNAVSYTLSDLNGKAALRGKLHEMSNKVDISNLPNGIYILAVVSSEGQTETVKIIKNR